MCPFLEDVCERGLQMGIPEKDLREQLQCPCSESCKWPASCTWLDLLLLRAKLRIQSFVRRCLVARLEQDLMAG